MTPPLTVTHDPGTVWRISFRPDPWAWADWRYATDHGRFNGRWGDQLAEFRTLYTGATLDACLLEVLAQFRPDPTVDADLDNILDEEALAAIYPDAPASTVSYRWAEDRLIGTAQQTGGYCFVTDSQSIANIQAGFPFRRFGLVPQLIDASTLKIQTSGI